MPDALPRQAEYGRQQGPTNHWVSPLPQHTGHLAKMDDFRGEGNDVLDTFFDHVNELAIGEICRQT